MAIYEVTLFSRYYGNQCVNRWNYIYSGIEASVSGSFGLSYAFGLAVPALTNTIFANLKGMTSNQVVYESFATKNLYDDEDFYSSPFLTAQTGVYTSEAMSPTQAYGFRTNQVTLAVARGTKRFAGVAEAEVSGGGIIGGAIMSGQLEPFAAKMSANLEYDDEGATLTYSPCVLGRQSYTTPSGKTAYRKYPTEAEQLQHIALSVIWEPYDQVRTQVSRQYGRGA